MAINVNNLHCNSPEDRGRETEEAEDDCRMVAARKPARIMDNSWSSENGITSVSSP